MADGLMALFLGSDLEVTTQLRWAVKLARARAFDLLVLQHVESKEGVTIEVALDGEAGGGSTPLARAVREFVDSSPDLRPGVEKAPDDDDPPGEEEGTLSIRLKEIRCPDLRELRSQLLAQVRKNKVKLASSVHRGFETTDADIVRERQLFLRYAPCEVILCYGFEPSTDVERVLVGVAGGPHASAALRFANALAKTTGERFTAVRINPEIGPDAEQVGARRLEAAFLKTLGADLGDVHRTVVVESRIDRGLKRAWDEGGEDLIVLGASRRGLLGNQPSRGTAARLLKGEPRPAIAIVRAGAPLRSRFSSLLEGSVERIVPQMDRENRIALVDRVQSSSNWDFDFFALMVLSTSIAAMGLVQNSAAVVIGAMLVAPLMTPLLGMGLALVQGNPVLARISLRAVLLGVVVSLMVGVLAGLLTPGFDEPTREMLGRGGPGMLDLFVAFASGLAAAYASSRPGLLAALPGVAIAAALVPPIATSGLALSLGNVPLAVGALLLFAINMVTIVLATMVSLWVVGLRRVGNASRWSLTAVGIVMLSVVALGVYLSLKPDASPTERQIPEALLIDMQEQLGDEYRLDSVAVAYDELGAQLNVRVLGDKLAPAQVADDIRGLARDHFDAPVRVRLITEVQAEVAPP